MMGIGHYAGLIDIGGRLALTLHTDGVGTKVLVAQAMRKYDTVGIDCVAMTVNDLICLGSEPIALLDYLALEREDGALVREVTKGLVRGAEIAEVPIVGGETAILGEMIKGAGGRGFDLACMGAGIVRKDRVVDGSAIRAGDTVVGLRSSGLHSNGYTLARKALIVRHSLEDSIASLGRTLGEELLIPTEIYVRPVLKMLRKVEVHGLAHITGGAFTKLTRLTGERRLSFRLKMMPDRPPIFEMLSNEARLSIKEMYSTFNMGIGFCVVLPGDQAEEAMRACGKEGAKAAVVGKVAGGSGVFIGNERLA